MKLTFLEISKDLERYISNGLVRSNLKHINKSADWIPETASVSLSDLYTDVRSHFYFDVPAGLFNKVIDDMTRIGLFKVDRKTKRIGNIAFDKLITEKEMASIKAFDKQLNASASTTATVSAEQEDVGGDS